MFFRPASNLLVPFMQPQFRRGRAAAGGGGGPDVYYDIETSANANANRSSNSSLAFWQTVTVTTGGSATKVRWYCRAYYGGTETVEVALYDSAGTSLLASGSGSVTGTGYKDIIFDTPATVASATDYIIATAFNGGSAELGFNSAAGTYSLDTNAGGSASFPFATLAADSTPAGKLVMGVYID